MTVETAQAGYSRISKRQALRAIIITGYRWFVLHGLAHATDALARQPL